MIVEWRDNIEIHSNLIYIFSTTRVPVADMKSIVMILLGKEGSNNRQKKSKKKKKKKKKNTIGCICRKHNG